MLKYIIIIHINHKKVKLHFQDVWQISNIGRNS